MIIQHMGYVNINENMGGNVSRLGRGWEGKLGEERLKRSGRPWLMVLIMFKGQASTERVTVSFLTSASTYSILYLYISINVYCIQVTDTLCISDCKVVSQNRVVSILASSVPSIISDT